LAAIKMAVREEAWVMAEAEEQLRHPPRTQQRQEQRLLQTESASATRGGPHKP